MSRTPQNQVELIELFCEKMKEHEIVNDCMINDYGRYGNFDIFIYAETMNRTNTNKLKKLVRVTIEHLKTISEDCDVMSLHYRSHSAPTAIRKWCRYDEKTKLIGYDRDFWSFDIDFSQYHSESNSFPELQKEV